MDDDVSVLITAVFGVQYLTINFPVGVLQFSTKFRSVLRFLDRRKQVKWMQDPNQNNVEILNKVRQTSQEQKEGICES
jgi:hypothetical protein